VKVHLIRYYGVVSVSQASCGPGSESSVAALEACGVDVTAGRGHAGDGVFVERRVAYQSPSTSVIAGADRKLSLVRVTLYRKESGFPATAVTRDRDVACRR